MTFFRNLDKIFIERIIHSQVLRMASGLNPAIFLGHQSLNLSRSFLACVLLVLIIFCVSVVYCDYTASGRSLKFIEDYIMTQILPSYGSTHTTTSVTSLQTTLFRYVKQSWQKTLGFGFLGANPDVR